MSETRHRWSTLGQPKSDTQLAREIVDHVRDKTIEYEDLVRVLVADLSREQLWELSNHCQALGLAADHLSAIIENCDRALTAARRVNEERELALMDEADNRAYDRLIDAHLEKRS